MLHVYNPDLVAAKAHRPDMHAHHAYEVQRARAREKAAARSAFIAAARGAFRAVLARLGKAFALTGRVRENPSVVLPQPGRGAAECETCA